MVITVEVQTVFAAIHTQRHTVLRRRRDMYEHGTVVEVKVAKGRNDDSASSRTYYILNGVVRQVIGGSVHTKLSLFFNRIQPQRRKDDC